MDYVILFLMSITLVSTSLVLVAIGVLTHREMALNERKKEIKLFREQIENTRVSSSELMSEAFSDERYKKEPACDKYHEEPAELPDVVSEKDASELFAYGGEFIKELSRESEFYDSTDEIMNLLPEKGLTEFDKPVKYFFGKDN